MAGFARSLTAAAVALSLCSVSTVAIAAEPAPPIAAAATTAPTNSWLTLSAMTTNSTAASSAAAAQYADDDGRPGFPPWPVLAVILATIGVAIYILASDDDGDLDGFDISPA